MLGSRKAVIKTKSARPTVDEQTQLANIVKANGNRITVRSRKSHVMMKLFNEKCQQTRINANSYFVEYAAGDAKAKKQPPNLVKGVHNVICAIENRLWPALLCIKEGVAYDGEVTFYRIQGNEIRMSCPKLIKEKEPPVAGETDVGMEGDFYMLHLGWFNNSDAPSRELIEFKRVTTLWKQLMKDKDKLAKSIKRVCVKKLRNFTRGLLGRRSLKAKSKKVSEEKESPEMKEDGTPQKTTETAVQAGAAPPTTQPPVVDAKIPVCPLIPLLPGEGDPGCGQSVLGLLCGVSGQSKSKELLDLERLAELNMKESAAKQPPVEVEAVVTKIVEDSDVGELNSKKKALDLEPAKDLKEPKKDAALETQKGPKEAQVEPTLTAAEEAGALELDETTAAETSDEDMFLDSDAVFSLGGEEVTSETMSVESEVTKSDEESTTSNFCYAQVWSEFPIGTEL